MRVSVALRRRIGNECGRSVWYDYVVTAIGARTRGKEARVRATSQRVNDSGCFGRLVSNRLGMHALEIY